MTTTTKAMERKKLKSIEVKYLGVTDTKPSRIKFYDSHEHEAQKMFSDRTGKYQKIISYNQGSSDNLLDQAIHYLSEIGFKIVGYSEMKDSYLIHVNNWDEKHITLK